MFKAFVGIKTDKIQKRRKKNPNQWYTFNDPTKQFAVDCKYTCLICNYYVLDICIHLSRAKTYLDGGQLITDA